MTLTRRGYARWSTIICLAGTVFSGYLSSVRMRSGVCAFNEPCPFFLGHPACYYGFGIFVTALLVSLVALLGRIDARWPSIANIGVAALGVVFAGSLTLGELHGGALVLPTCAWGLLFFAMLLALSAWSTAVDGRRAST